MKNALTSYRESRRRQWTPNPEELTPLTGLARMLQMPTRRARRWLETQGIAPDAVSVLGRGRVTFYSNETVVRARAALTAST